jgi:hypothetical protein
VRLIQHHEYLITIAKTGRQLVLASDLQAAASLLKLGYALAEDSHDGPEIYLTTAGRKYAAKIK